MMAVGHNWMMKKTKREISQILKCYGSFDAYRVSRAKRTERRKNN